MAAGYGPAPARRPSTATTATCQATDATATRQTCPVAVSPETVVAASPPRAGTVPGAAMPPGPPAPGPEVDYGSDPGSAVGYVGDGCVEPAAPPVQVSTADSTVPPVTVATTVSC
ncbi:hypothetical protein O7543_11685 [Solwaraspora sp. WMMA2080]|uniref:hypothetical protein n=1 Tax=unclassified Solwaraspora TaxID=2627926 RepID=UPI00248B708C|nr:MULTISPECIES: hypothetical protein [unclassified Solwaraspora]WBB98418.1 hypothetical protein O7553_05680 [Solwaraspora sp. WMMA2059]WBC23029.1 hypothetical protein O7543_11685 [Solwaraspora sp. WMMA2080]